MFCLWSYRNWEDSKKPTFWIEHSVPFPTVSPSPAPISPLCTRGSQFRVLFAPLRSWRQPPCQLAVFPLPWCGRSHRFLPPCPCAVSTLHGPALFPLCAAVRVRTKFRCQVSAPHLPMHCFLPPLRACAASCARRSSRAAPLAASGAGSLSVVSSIHVRQGSQGHVGDPRSPGSSRHLLKVRFGQRGHTPLPSCCWQRQLAASTSSGRCLRFHL